MAVFSNENSGARSYTQRISDSHNVEFTPLQVKFLQDTFPERIFTGTESATEVQNYHGTRRVVLLVQQRMSKGG